jgi:bifunctional non-homologous end joining protein LigD
MTPVWHSNSSGAWICVKAPFPSFVEPALASEINKVPSGSGWVHEIKFDGYRVQVHLPIKPSRSSPGAAMTGAPLKIAHDA